MIIYKVTNLLNGKIYIGQSIKDDSNYFGSGVLIKNAIEKHGKDNFIKEIIDTANSVDELNEKEIYWISEYNSTDKKIGYNLCSGGKGLKIYVGKSDVEKEYIFRRLSEANKQAWSKKISNISEEELNHLKKMKSEVSKIGWNIPEEDYEKRCKNISDGLLKSDYDFSEKSRKFWENLEEEEYNQIISKISESNKRYWENLPDTRKKEISDLSKEYWQNLSLSEKFIKSENMKSHWKELPKNDREYLILKMKDSSRQYHDRVRMLVDSYENDEELSNEDLEIVQRYYIFLGKVSSNSKEMWSNFTDEKISSILIKKSLTMKEKYKNDPEFVNRRNKSLRETKCLRFVVKDLNTNNETKISGRKELCDFIGISLHKYKKYFGTFETKLYNNFFIQKELKNKTN